MIQDRKPEMIDLLLTDVIMPHMFGIELARHIGETHQGIKIIMISGYTENAPILDSSAMDESSFLQKPFLPSALLNRVREVLDR